MSSSSEPAANIQYLCRKCMYDHVRTHGTLEHNGKTYQKIGFPIEDTGDTPPLEWMWVRLIGANQGILDNIPLYAGTGVRRGALVTFWTNEDGVGYAGDVQPDLPPDHCECA